MSKNLAISTGKSKFAQVEHLEQEFRDHPSSKTAREKTYRFTAVLPDVIGQRLRLHCAKHNLRMKNVFADAVVEFLNRHDESFES